MLHFLFKFKYGLLSVAPSTDAGINFGQVSVYMQGFLW